MKKPDPSTLSALMWTCILMIIFILFRPLGILILVLLVILLLLLSI